VIEHIRVGDITAPIHVADIIIGMNADLDDVRGIGREFVKNVIPARALKLGSVVSFDFGDGRDLHMIICHKLGKGGWVNADRHVRFGLDYLEHTRAIGKTYSIVQIGTGRIGIRDHADPVAILSAMATSFLPVTLFVNDLELDQMPADLGEQRPVLRPFRAWVPHEGEVALAA
jgi:hypothetical protein